MKITTFNPMIFTKKPEEVIALFEALGFERHHHKSDKTENEEQGLAFSSVRMKDANGFYIDVCTANSDRIERDITVIRMNVDNFDEAAEMLKSNGFTESKIVPPNYTSSSKYANFISPSRYGICLIQHIKKEDN